MAVVLCREVWLEKHVLDELGGAAAAGEADCRAVVDGGEDVHVLGGGVGNGSISAEVLEDFFGQGHDIELCPVLLEVEDMLFGDE